MVRRGALFHKSPNLVYAIFSTVYHSQSDITDNSISATFEFRVHTSHHITLQVIKFLATKLGGWSLIWGRICIQFCCVSVYNSTTYSTSNYALCRTKYFWLVLFVKFYLQLSSLLAKFCLNSIFYANAWCKGFFSCTIRIQVCHKYMQLNIQSMCYSVYSKCNSAGAF